MIYCENIIVVAPSHLVLLVATNQGINASSFISDNLSGMKLLAFISDKGSNLFILSLKSYIPMYQILPIPCP